MQRQIKSSKVFSKIEEIKKLAPQVFSTAITESYRQKMVYNLLNLVRADDKEKFLWTLLRLANARKEDDNSKKLVFLLNELYGLRLSKDMFKKWAYTMIMGIMSSKNKEGGK